MENKDLEVLKAHILGNQRTNKLPQENGSTVRSHV